MNTPEEQREQFSRTLVAEMAAPQYAVEQEEHRIEDLVDETWVDPYAHTPHFMQVGRQALARTGLYTPKQPFALERPGLEQAQERRREWIHEELDQSRGLVRNMINGVDDTAVDKHLGLRTDSSILPPLFRELHRRIEEQTGEQVTFLRWMADFATNEQLLNVWQWHRDYLRQRNDDPAFQERVESIKDLYLQGIDAAIAAGELHPSMADQKEAVQAVEFTHLSPLSPIASYAHAYADRKNSRVYMELISYPHTA